MRSLEVVSSLFCFVLIARCDDVHQIDLHSLSNESTNPSSLQYTTINVNGSSKPVPSFTIDGHSSSPSPIPSSSTHKDVSFMLRSNSSDTEQKQDVLSVEPLNNGSAVDTEVKDLLDNRQGNISFHHHDDIMNSSVIVDHTKPNDTSRFLDGTLNTDVERIEDGEKTEDELRKHKEIIVRFEDVVEDTSTPLAVILVSSFVALSVVVYAGFLLWRKYLEDRYGSRTLLVEAEEFAEPNDMKHFTI